MLSVSFNLASVPLISISPPFAVISPDAVNPVAVNVPLVASKVKLAFV